MIQQSSDSKIITNTPKKVGIAHIESELNGLWAQFNENISEGKTVMRACMSNLIIYCDTNDEAIVINQELTSIVAAHPSRILLLTGKDTLSGKKVEAFVSLYHMQVPDGLQVCGERIDVHSSIEKAGRLPSVARSQLIGDLPTTLWWASRQPPPEAGDVFFELAKLADQIIYDNMGWVKPTRGVAVMTRWVAGQQDELVVYNLAWRRTSLWRKLICQVMDPLVAPGALQSLNRIEISHGPHALALTWLMVGWLSFYLKWKPVEGKPLSNSELVWQFENNQQKIKVIARRLPEGKPLLYKILFNWNCPDKKQGHTCFERLDDERIGIVETLESVSPRIFTAQIPERSTLVSSQLAFRDRDKVFENALKASNLMVELFQN